jgi:hypothetical protein
MKIGEKVLVSVASAAVKTRIGQSLTCGNRFASGSRMAGPENLFDGT